MSHAVPHIPHAAPRYFAMCLGKRGISIHYLCSSLTDDDKAHDGGLLSTLVSQEIFFV